MQSVESVCVLNKFFSQLTFKLPLLPKCAFVNLGTRVREVRLSIQDKT